MSDVNTTIEKKDSIFSTIKLGLVLAAYAVASCTVLALVNSITAPVIEQNQLSKAKQGMQEFFVDASDFEKVLDFNFTTSSSITIDSLYAAKNGSTLLGAVAQVTGPTYDKATLLVGLSVDGTITGVRFLENTDSPGFGSKASDATFKLSNGQTFYGQFTGKKAADGFIANQTFDAISGATITSNGVASLLEQGTACISAYLKEYN